MEYKLKKNEIILIYLWKMLLTFLLFQDLFFYFILSFAFFSFSRSVLVPAHHALTLQNAPRKAEFMSCNFFSFSSFLLHSYKWRACNGVWMWMRVYTILWWLLLKFRMRVQSKRAAERKKIIANLWWWHFYGFAWIKCMRFSHIVESI